jgi:peptidoglycan/LPS O-acetylase OafA/YrhL
MGMISVILALAVAKLFLSVFLVMLVLFTFDGPLFGTEQAFNALRMTQIFLGAMTVWGLVSENRRVHVAISLAVLAGALAVVIIRFLPGQVSSSNSTNYFNHVGGSLSIAAATFAIRGPPIISIERPHYCSDTR